MRVKNESRWIKRSIASIAPLCNAGILVLDDHSTDDTPDVARASGAKVWASTFEGLDEVRDKNFLMASAHLYAADWVIMIDGDEAVRDYDLVNLA